MKLQATYVGNIVFHSTSVHNSNPIQSIFSFSQCRRNGLDDAKLVEQRKRQYHQAYDMRLIHRARCCIAVLVYLLACVPFCVSTQGDGGLSPSTETERVPPLLRLSPPGTLFEELPSASMLNGGSNVLSISIEVATLLVEDSSGNVLMHVNAPVYRDVLTGETSPFGPVLRLQPGGRYMVTLTNELLEQPSNSSFQAMIGATNLHMHGFHGSTGVSNITSAASYHGGDNIFVSIPGKKSESSTPHSMTFFGTVPEDHLPGNHWYHAHHHMSGTIQVFGAHGAIIVEGIDSDKWLPTSNGCKQVREVLSKALQRIMIFEMYPFVMYPLEEDGVSPNMTAAEFWATTNYQVAAAEGNATYCCDRETVENAPNALFGPYTIRNIVFLNGGLEPVVEMQPGVWQRWSILLGAFTGVLMLQIPEQCEIMLISKDGVFLMEIPRRVSYVLVPAAGRAEVIARCDGIEGDEFDVISSPVNTTAGSGMNDNTFINRQKLFSIRIATDGVEANDTVAGQGLLPKACTPLRPAYAADIRDESLKAFNISVHHDPVPTFTDPTASNPYTGCSMSGELFNTSQNPYILPIGKLVEWSVAYTSGHPLHTHINPFQIVDYGELNNDTSLDGGWFEQGDYHDTFFLPMGRWPGEPPSNVTIRFQPGPFSGYTVAHCHFLNHADAGCMHMLQYTCPDDATVSTNQLICSEPMPVPGTFLLRTDPVENGSGMLLTSPLCLILLFIMMISGGIDSL